MEPDDAGERLSEWSPEVRLLANLFDRVGDLIRVQATGDPKIDSYPRPITAVERARARMDLDRYRRLVERVRPKS